MYSQNFFTEVLDMRKSSALAAVLDAASMLSACGSVNGSAEKSSEETAAASSAVTTTAGTVDLCAVEEEPSDTTKPYIYYSFSIDS